MDYEIFEAAAWLIFVWGILRLLRRKKKWKRNWVCPDPNLPKRRGHEHKSGMANSHSYCGDHFLNFHGSVCSVVGHKCLQLYGWKYHCPVQTIYTVRQTEATGANWTVPIPCRIHLFNKIPASQVIIQSIKWEWNMEEYLRVSELSERIKYSKIV